jgi:hypothetical protein
VPSVLAVYATYRPPEERTHGGVRVKRCPDHPTADLVIRSTTHCAECDRQIGGTTETLRKQVDAVGPDSPTTCVRSNSEEQLDAVDDHDSEAMAERAAAMVAIPDPIRAPVVKAPRKEPVNIGQIRFRRDRERLKPPVRCPAPGCRALEFRALPDGSWRCLKSAHDPRDFEPLATVAGGSE